MTNTRKNSANSRKKVELRADLTVCREFETYFSGNEGLITVFAGYFKAFEG
jgi:hypothetical protein